MPEPPAAGRPTPRRAFALDSISLQREDQILLLLTLIIGAVVGLVVVAFILVTENLGTKLLPPHGAPWRRLLIPIAGSLTAGFFLARYFPNARGSGIPQTKTALFLRDGYISFRTVAGKFSLCALTLASGIALGREGPSVHVAAGISSVLGRRLGLSPRSVRALVPIGAAAALAAAFNTPIAAVLFTLEEVMGDLHAPVLGSIVLSSATSWMVLHLLLGDEPLFHVPAYQLVHPVEFVIYALLGVAGGFVSVAFVKLLLWMRKQFARLPSSTAWLQPVAGGITVAVFGWFVPQVLGVGYGFVDDALNGKLVIATMALLVGLKVVATATCYASGNAGGIFGPSLFMGAMTGGAIGGIAHMLLPDYTASAGAYALVGMGAAFAGTVRVPLTSVIMIFEITRDYTIIVPLMIANMMSYFISSRLQQEPVYDALQHQDGIHLPSGGRAREDLITVALAMQIETQPLRAEWSVTHALSAFEDGRAAWPVTDDRGLRGMVTRAQLESTASMGFGEQTLGDLVPNPGPIERLNESTFPHVHADHSLQSAMQRLAHTGLAVLPVVSRANIRELRGTVSQQDILDAFALGRPAAVSETQGSPNQASPKLYAGVLASLMALALLMGFMNYFFRIERTNRADEHYRSAQDLMRRGSYEEAIEQYRDALSASHRADYRLALGLALVEGGHAGEAPVYLNEVLREEPGNGMANLGLARVAALAGNMDDAVAHYQRAIYGSWASPADPNRFQARIELIDALSKTGRRAQANAELISAAAAAPPGGASERQVNRMLGDAEFAGGDYAAARDAYRKAAMASQADLCDRILALDPSLPGLSPTERYTHGLDLLRSVTVALARCGDTAALPRKKPAFGDIQDLAVRLWTARPAQCAANDEALSRVMAKLGAK